MDAGQSWNNEIALATAPRSAGSSAGGTVTAAAAQGAAPFYLGTPFGEVHLGTVPQGVNRVLAGIGQGMTSVARHAGNLVGLESNQQLRDAAKLDAPLLNTFGGNAGSLIGQMAATAPIGLGASAAIGRAGTLGATLARSAIMDSALQGAAQGGIMADPGSRGTGAFTGALAGAALPALGGIAGKAMRGISVSPEAQTLMDGGVKSLTLGQMNPNSIWNRVEQSLDGTPGAGLVHEARVQPMREYVRSMVEQSAAPGTVLKTTSHDFNDLLDEAASSFEPAYELVKGFPVGPKIMRTNGPDQTLADAFNRVAQKPRIGLSEADRQSLGSQLSGKLKETIASAKQDGGMQSDHLMGLRSTLRDAIRGESGADNASRARKELYSDAADKITQALESQLPAETSDALRNTDQQYAKFAIMRNVAKAIKDSPNGPTPFAISNAIAKATDSNTYARGGGWNREMSKAAMHVFQNNVPRTGLTGVGMLGLPAAGLTALAHYVPHVGIPASVGLGGLAAMDLTSGGRLLATGGTGVQRVGAALLDKLGTSIPQQVKNLPGAFGRAGLISFLGQR